MNNKTIVIAICLFLAILFVSTIGTFYTGYTVASNDLTLRYYPYPFIKNSVPNGLYIVIPSEPTVNEYNSATVIANSLKTRVAVPTIIKENELPDGVHNLILIGTPCDSDLIASELNTDNCNSNLEKGEGLIKLVNHGRSNSIIVTGYDSNELSKAALVLTNHNFYPLRGKEVHVSGSVGSIFLNYF